jgi:hypothetical protein
MLKVVRYCLTCSRYHYRYRNHPLLSLSQSCYCNCSSQSRYHNRPLLSRCRNPVITIVHCCPVVAIPLSQSSIAVPLSQSSITIAIPLPFYCFIVCSVYRLLITATRSSERSCQTEVVGRKGRSLERVCLSSLVVYRFIGRIEAVGCT